MYLTEVCNAPQSIISCNNSHTKFYWIISKSHFLKIISNHFQKKFNDLETNFKTCFTAKTCCGYYSIDDRLCFLEVVKCSATAYVANPNLEKDLNRIFFLLLSIGTSSYLYAESMYFSPTMVKVHTEPFCYFKGQFEIVCRFIHYLFPSQLCNLEA